LQISSPKVMDQKELTHLRLKLISKWKEEHSKRLKSRVRNSLYSSEISNDEEEEDPDDVENRNDDDCSGKKIIFISAVIL